jgi:hypothetical protein
LWEQPNTIIARFHGVDALLHVITTNGKCLHWEKNQHKAFEEFKGKINEALVSTLPNLQKPFEVEMNASGYAMGVVLMQRGKLIYDYSKFFHGTSMNDPTYDKDPCALVKAPKQWNH